MNPEISLILPCYNVEEYIAKTIDSVLNQNFQNFELIVINDGSSDNTGNILSTLYQNNVRIRIIEQENSGVSAARNTGLRLAKGKYVAFIDGDDWISSTFLSEYMRLQNNETETLIYQGFVSEYQNNNVTEKLPKRTFVDNQISEAITILEEKRCLGGACNKLFVNAIIKKHKLLFDLRFSYGEDKIFTLQYLQYVEKIIFSDNCAYHYNRKTENSLSKKHHKSLELLKFSEEEFYLFNKIERKYPSELLKLIINARYSSFSKYVLLSMYRKTDNAAKEQRNQLKRKIIAFDKSNIRHKNFEIEVPRIINVIFASDFLMELLMTLKENFVSIYKKFI